MKLTTPAQVSVDGVMQGLGGPDEDRRGGFERGGWAPPLFHDEATTFLREVYQRADAFLFGRRTYEIFAGSWGIWADPGDDPIWTALNTRPKYVCQYRPRRPEARRRTAQRDGSVTRQRPQSGRCDPQAMGDGVVGCCAGPQKPLALTDKASSAGMRSLQESSRSLTG